MDSLHSLTHIVHVLAAGIWLGGLVFTTMVVSPAFKRMNWPPPERIAVRSEVGKQYTKIARLNLGVLLLVALADGAARGWSTQVQIEMALIVLISVLSELHARVFAPRLGLAARSGDETARQSALRVSIIVSMFNLLLSFAVAILAI
jgi:uncharacterized membrane protein